MKPYLPIPPADRQRGWTYVAVCRFLVAAHRPAERAS